MWASISASDMYYVTIRRLWHLFIVGDGVAVDKYSIGCQQIFYLIIYKAYYDFNCYLVYQL